MNKTLVPVSLLGVRSFLVCTRATLSDVDRSLFLGVATMYLIACNVRVVGRFTSLLMFAVVTAVCVELILIRLMCERAEI